MPINGFRDTSGKIVAFKGTAGSLTALEQDRCIGFVYGDSLIIARFQDPNWAGYELMRKVLLEGKEDFYPGELSGGQQLRVAIARSRILVNLGISAHFRHSFIPELRFSG